MSEGYRRVVFRWATARGIISAALLVATIILLQLFFINYMLSHGFSPTNEQVKIGTLQVTSLIVLLPAVGVTLVILSSWMYAVDRTMRVRVKTDLRKQRMGADCRIVEVSALILGAFSLSLFVPYIFGSNWFIAGANNLSQRIPQLGQFLASTYGTVISLMDLDSIWKFALSENLAACSAAFFAALYVRRQGRAGKPR
jgi:hypothetical protein